MKILRSETVGMERGKRGDLRVPPQVPVLYAKRGLYERFRRALAGMGWKQKGEHVLLGLSGGRDSVVLLHLLLVSGHRVIAAHLNHCIRGTEGDRDERWVRDLCRAWKVPLEIKRENVPARAKRHGLSMEEAARIARYRFFAEIAWKQRLRKILVAHHERDQAETVLLKIFRGCDSRLLRGMTMIRALPCLNWKKREEAFRGKQIQLIRPLLKAPSSEIALYARQNRLVFCLDSSNRDLSNPRNWIRHRLLPLIARRMNRNVVRTLARLGET